MQLMIGYIGPGSGPPAEPFPWVILAVAGVVVGVVLWALWAQFRGEG